MKTISVKEMREAEQKAMARFGISEDTLMETAGRNIAQEILRDFAPQNKNIIFACGYGGNGGDGLVAARYLKGHALNAACYIIKSKKPYKDLVQINFNRALNAGVSVKEIEHTQEFEQAVMSADIIVDALLGIGFEGEVKGLFKDVIEAINSAKKTVIAIDVPSGLNADSGAPASTTIKAAQTYAMGFIKNGEISESAKPYTGTIKVLPIGLPT